MFLLRSYTRVVCLLFILCPLFPCAQKHGYHIQNYTTDNGLPQNSVTGVAFDKAGYCWLGTEMGLVRFDGRKFTVFNSANLPGVYSPRIRLCNSDNEGNVYMKAEKAELITIKTDDRQLAPYPVVAEGRKNWLWNSYNEVPNVVAAKGRKQIPPFDASSGYTYLLPSGDIYCFDSNRLYYLENESVVVADTAITYSDDIVLGAGDHFIVIQKNQPVKWWKKGARQKDLVSVPGDLQANKDFQQGRFQCFYKCGQAFIYAGDNLYGVYEKADGFTTKLLLEGLDIPAMIAVFYNEEQHKYYIGSLVAGLFVVSPSQFSFLGNKPEIFSKSVFSQAIRNNGDIICQRFLYEPSGRIRELPLNAEVGATLWLDKDRYLYYSNEPALFRYDFERNVNSRIALLDSRPSSIFVDRFDSTSIVVGTSFGIGKFYEEAIHDFRRLPGDEAIISVMQSGRDSFILATKSGVKWYDFANNKIYRKLLDSVYVRNIYQDENGCVWIATYERGFYLFQNGQLSAFPCGGGLKTVHTFIEDGRGNFWLPTNNGLFVVSKKILLDFAKGNVRDIYFYMYSTSDNLPTNEFNGGCTPSYIRTKDGRISIPSIVGLVQFDPLRLNPHFPAKGIHVDEYRLNDSLFQPSDGALTLDPDYGEFSLRVSCPYFGNEENLQLVYTVKGLGNNWQPVPANNEIVLSRIPAGDYELTVRKLNDPGHEHQAFKFVFSIKPWFYNTWWFYLMLVMISCLAAFLYVRIRMGRLKDRNTSLQAIIQAQTADLSKTVAQLRASENALRESNVMKDRVTTMILHDLRSPIRFLHTISSQLRKKHRHLTKEELQSKLDILQSSTGSLNDFTEQFFVWAASQHENFKINKEAFSLQVLFNELEELYRDIVSAGNNLLIVEPTQLTVHTDRNILAVIIRNLLDNAGKNTVNGSIRLSAYKDVDLLVLSISDTGAGISEEAIAEFYTGNDQAGSTGNGRVVIIKLLEKIGGKLSISSRPGKGTTFSVALNCHRSGQTSVQAD